MSPAVGSTLPASVRVDVGEGGLALVRVSTPSASAEVYLQGAHVASWMPAGQQPVLWMSAESRYAPGAPLRGGVPVCFPWFGPAPTGDGPLHGFARTAQWTLVEAAERGADVVLTFALEGPDLFEARYEVSVGTELGLRFEVSNVGAVPLTYAEAFHTYLAVSDVQQAAITGLEHAPFVDRLHRDRAEPAAGEPLRLTGETERLYPQPGRVVVHDPTGGRDLVVDATGSADTVVWNPWTAKSASMPDFGDDEWTGMVCVETGNVHEHALTLDAGSSHAMTTTISVATTPPRQRA
ncbi:D-hexose-6-phosphate mutarotase [uncultured Cellulomonas sp.]|uniref:D-hexose-6-phosphate mutarotase n=1 Tax=uncultured Cellulomonas sp. TaxID=189682 RepID=UPI0028E2CF99|nr:D-hexose-6-phosphate mutarotase [uncultured Cellulomonas sp.]